MALLPAAILEDVLVIADNTEARMSFEVPWSPVSKLHPIVPLSSLSNFSALPQHGLTLRGWKWQDLAVASSSLGSLEPRWPLLSKQWGGPGQPSPDHPSPGTKQPSLSLWTQPLQSLAPLEAHSVISFTCVLSCFDCLSFCRNKN